MNSNFIDKNIDIAALIRNACVNKLEDFKWDVKLAVTKCS